MATRTGDDMDATRFDALTRKLSSRRTMLTGAVGGAVATLLRFATAGEEVAAAVACRPNQKRCGNRCIPKRACCPRTQKRCGGRCIAKGACCTVTHKRCGAACIPKAACCTITHKLCGAACIPKGACCTDADCNGGGSTNYRLCAQGQCVVNQGTCPAGANVCITAAGASCGAVGSGCRCFTSKNPVRTRCGTGASVTPGGVCSACLSDADCAAAHPQVPGVFCAYGGGANCLCGSPQGICMAPCVS